MTFNPRYSLGFRDRALDAALDVLSGGYCDVYDGTQPADPDVAVSTQTKLARFALGSPAFAASSSAVKTANAVTSTTALASGTASWFRLVTSAGTAVLDGTVGASNADMLLAPTAVVTSGDPLAVASLSVSASNVTWDPSYLGSALAMWLDGQDLTTMFTTSAETTPTANGGSVGRWKDKSGNGWHADQSTASAKPTRSDSALNGKLGLTFDGGDTLVAQNFGALTAGEFWVVFRGSGVSAGADVIGKWTIGSVSSYILTYANTTTPTLTALFRGSSTTVANAQSTNTVMVGRSRFSAGSPGSVTAQVDSLSTATGSFTYTNIGTDTFQVGQRNGGTNSLTGAVGEVIVVNRVLTAGEVTSMQAYLRAKWGTA